MAKGAAGIGLSLGGIVALAVLLALVVRKGPIVAIGLMAALAVAFVVLSAVSVIFGKKNNGKDV